MTRSKTCRAAPALAPQRLLLLALAIDSARHLAQREFAQRGQVAGLEKILERLLDLCRRIDFSFAQAFAKLLDRHVDVDDLIRFRDEGIGHHLAHFDAGDAPHQRIERLDMLDVDRGDHADAVGDQLLDILVRFSCLEPGALVCASSSTIATSGLRAIIASMSISVRVVPRYSMVRRGMTSRSPIFSAVSARPCVSTQADHHVDSLGAQLVRLFQHLVGFPDTGGGADINLQPPFQRLSDQIKKRLGLGALVILHAMCSNAQPYHFSARACAFGGASLSSARLRVSTLTPGSPSRPR